MRSHYVALSVYWVSLSVALLNYGSVELLTVTLLALPTFFLFIVLLATGGIPTHTGSTLWAAASLMVLLLAWIGAQTVIPLDAPFSEAAWKEIQAFLPGAASTISVSLADDRAAAMRIAVPFGVFMVGLLLFSTDERASGALRLLSGLSGLISIFSIVQFTIAPDQLLFDAKRAYLSSLTGIFVNRNTAATFFGLALLLNASIVEASFGKIGFRRVSSAILAGARLSPAMQTQLWFAAFHVVLLFSTLTALMLTKSRGGVVAALIAVCCLLLLKAFSRLQKQEKSGLAPAKERRWIRILIGASILLAIVIIFFSLGQRVLLRSQIQSAFEDGRFCVLPGIVAAVWDNLPLGAGLSSFPTVFPAYRDATCGIAGVWDRAHNVYLEGLLTLGIVFPLSALLFSLWLSAVFIIGIRRRRSARYAGELGIASLVLIAAHSAIDFSLQISGLAIYFAAMLAPIVTLSLRPPGKKRTLKEQSTRHSMTA